MISFLIPTYNFDCTSLVLTLFEQASILKEKSNGTFDFEILIADDASPLMEMVTCYQKIQKLEGCCFISLKENLGRAKIRNFLAIKSHYDYLVFMDCDAEICTTDFVESYWNSRNLGDVICGALRNPEKCPRGGELRYRYEKAAEVHRGVDFRNSQPYTYFTTFNVMFHRSVFDSLRFDERCTEYGYEDALMGVMLEQRGFTVAHIDNPLVHNGIDNNAIYLSKVETSLRVLLKLGEPLQSASALVLLKRRLEQLHLLSLIKLLYVLSRKILRSNLLGAHPSMGILKFYKLGYYIQQESSDRKKSFAN